MTSPHYLPKAVFQIKSLALDMLPNDDDQSLDSAHKYCRSLALRHYENFFVASHMLPRKLKRHFFNVYAYCRWSDDLADEVDDKNLSLKLLEWWEKELQACYKGDIRHPVFVALKETINQFEIPITPFRDLLKAFRQDQVVKRYQSYADLLEYCCYSANPVGHLVLYLCGYRDSQRQSFSDKTCTALQLCNFWQDIRLDLANDRIYLPLEDLHHYRYSEEDLKSGIYNDNFKNLMMFEVNRTRKLLEEGLNLSDLVNHKHKVDITLFNRFGWAILDQMEKQNFNVLARRPKLSKIRKISIFLEYFFRIKLLHKD